MASKQPASPNKILVPGFEVAVQYYESLKKYLEKHAEKGQTISQQRQNARDKLTRLSKPQFQELATDVYDEMTRRQFNSAEMPFLPVRDDFHPKRNQARQKLATLPKNRFKDLASDVFFELERRFPQLLEGQQEEAALLASPPTSATTSVSPAATAIKSVEIGKENAVEKSPGQTQNQNKSPTTQPPIVATAVTDKKPMLPPTQDKTDASFGNLDALMADLGDMISKPGDLLDPTPSTDKLRTEYESKLSSMTKRIAQLETELAAKSKQQDTAQGSKVQQLEEQLRTQKQTNQTLETTLSTLRDDHSRLQEDYRMQQEVAEDVRKEAAALLNEIKALSNRNDDLLAERDSNRESIKNLTEENQRLQSQVRDLQSQLKAAASQRRPSEQLNSSSASTSTIKGSNFSAETEKIWSPQEDGAIDEGKTTSYKDAVDGLKRAARSDNPTEVLIAMKSIVIACKSITEDVEIYESNPTVSISLIDRENLLNFKTDLSGCLTRLMAVAKQHATGGAGGSPTKRTSSEKGKEIDAAVEELSDTIQEIVRLIGVKKAIGGGVGGKKLNDSREDGSKGLSLNGASPKKENAPLYEVDELRLYLEKQTDLIVQAIQSLLYAMRQATFGQDFQDTINGITSIVSNLITACRKTFREVPEASQYKVKGESVLKDLLNSNDRLAMLGKSFMSGNMGGGSGGDDEKPSKQKLASASYEVAKYTKELVSLFD